MAMRQAKVNMINFLLFQIAAFCIMSFWSTATAFTMSIFDKSNNQIIDTIASEFFNAYQVNKTEDSDLTYSSIHYFCQVTNIVFEEFLFGNEKLVAAKSASKWTFGAFKSTQKWAKQMTKRGWTETKITEAITKGEKFSATNMVNKANSATRFVHPTTGRSVVQDDVTKEILQIGGDGFVW